METQRTELDRRETSNLTDRHDAHTQRVSPPVDIYENDDEFLLVTDFPGVASDGLSIRIDGTELVVAGTQASALGDGARPLHFTRSFRVPPTVNAEKISAQLTQGVLRLRLPKSEAAKPRRIEVKAG